MLHVSRDSSTIFDTRSVAMGERRINGSSSDRPIYPYHTPAGSRARRERRRSGRDARHAVHAERRVDPEINGALITLIEALRRIDTTPIGPVSFRDTDRSYDK